ncbi:PREDICTED: rho-related BTB domain-containing protein 2-like [Rhagoletis zephyria]|uniref:rho-related BTB domain-containing protein 2-like n=1 Tax=Rhagoletis zephyria TaxID=28612 RepID=UPI000811A899|nr:PREDICTED: rho-related BTB domain-containing protein 2-like [Rhagoletis zephyria]
MDLEQSHQELVKCVVVGDTAVGKTRLICAKACSQNVLELGQLMSTHIPTVWAIDQYRIHKEVLERSWEVVDGVNVSLRLWDTFGDHDKDRRFAYGRSDVVLLCFSIANPLSLRNCKNVWYPEIRKFCPNTPIVLVGCKNDLRHMFRDENFQSLCRERSPFFRPLRECDILTPDQGRQVAKEMNAPYYESSVLTGHGVKEVFENVIRSALISRRHQRFWMTNLKHVRNCLLQEPYCPPRPLSPQLKVPESQYEKDMRSLLSRQAYTDVVFVHNAASVHCHKIVMVAASDIFHTLFTYHHYNQMSKAHTSNSTNSSTSSSTSSTDRALTKCASDISIASSMDEFDRQKHKLFNDDSLLDWSSVEGDAFLMDNLTRCLRYLDLVQFNSFTTDYDELLCKLKKYIDEVKCGVFAKRFVFFGIEKGLFSDVIFKLEDGTCYAHKAVLMARCTFMEAMFKGNFQESSSTMIVFPGVTRETFYNMLYYIYSDHLIDSVSHKNCLPLIELANQLCLFRLISLVEERIITELVQMEMHSDINAIVLKLLEPAQMHNADQLSDFCLYQIAVSYNEICHNNSKLLRSLHPENQAYLNRNRWPPVWYLKERDYFERCVREREWSENPKSFKRHKMNSGCFCFSKSKSSRALLKGPHSSSYLPITFKIT